MSRSRFRASKSFQKPPVPFQKVVVPQLCPPFPYQAVEDTVFDFTLPGLHSQKISRIVIFARVGEFVAVEFRPDAGVDAKFFAEFPC